MSGALVLAAVFAAQPAPAQTVPPERGTFRYMPLSLEAGVEKFRAICLEPLLDPEALERAVLASGLEFSRDTSVAAGEWLWTSRYGEVYFRSNSAMADGRPMQDCDVRFVIRERLTHRRLADRVGRLLAPGRARIDADLRTAWDLGGNFADRIELAGFAPGDTRFVDLNRRHIYPGPERQEIPR
jgi:hypothetical protein